MSPESASCWISKAFCVHHWFFSILTCNWTAAFALAWASSILAVDVILPGDESFPLGIDKPLDFGIVLIIRVLMFPRFVTKDGFAGIHDGSREGPNVFRYPGDTGLVISTDYCSRAEHIAAGFGADNDIVNEMPAFRAGMHPRCLELGLLTEKCLSDGQVIFGALC